MKTSQYVREVLLYIGIDGIVNETAHTMRALSHTKNFIPRIRTSAVLTEASPYKAATDSICFRLMFSQLCDVHEIYENYSLTKVCSFTLERFSKPNIRFGSGRTGLKIVSKFRLTHNRKLRSANRNTIDHTIACPALLLWCPAVENRGPCVPKKCSLSNCASPGGLLLPSPRSLVFPWPTPLAH